MMFTKDPLENYLEILHSFEENEVEYILIGGLAVILHGMPRFTLDMDVFLKGSKENINHLKKALKSLFPKDQSIDELSAEEFDRYSVIRYGPPEGDFYIDFITRIGEAFRFEDLEYEIREINDFKLRVATVETLIKMKKNTIREKDKMDVLFLEQLIKKGK